ncbi:MAG: rRNA maturation RNase YbeY [Firmicutes bacterium]|nr:rRNA maturation RNase YbeY [Bacillota bacterium]
MSLLLTNEQETVTLPASLEELLVQVVQLVLEREQVDSQAEVSLVLVDDRRIQQLNRDYRGLDKPTDVLSFALEESSPDEPEFDDPTAGLVLGDIIISLETAQRQSLEYGHSLEREVAYLTVHGLLHLLGYDHQDEVARAEMRRREEEILTEVSLPRTVSE